MSVFWRTDRMGSDGDFIHGHVKVNYWRSKAEFLAEVESQLAQIREQAEAEYDRIGPGDLGAA